DIQYLFFRFTINTFLLNKKVGRRWGLRTKNACSIAATQFFGQLTSMRKEEPAFLPRSKNAHLLVEGQKAQYTIVWQD
ncbi:MAG: hypothetical protein IJI14_04500, partial [Anaerolineaceae bacterium]|nr:hypothetical protein [Anaerolineaceae bacterium]